jgi:TolB protein
MTPILLRWLLSILIGCAVLILVAAHIGQMIVMGAVIVFDAALPGSEVDYIYILDVERGLPANLTHGQRGSNCCPVWSPDGKYIAFISGQNTNREIYRMDANGKNRRRLTASEKLNSSPVWSPDGTQIAFVSVLAAGGNFEIDRMNADGSSLRLLTPLSSGNSSPVWSPDGRKLAFISQREGNSDIYLMNADGTQIRQMTRNRTDDWQPVWSPNGQQIAFLSEYEGPPKIYVMDVADITLRSRALGHARPLVTGQMDMNSGPSWSPDGSQLAFFGWHSGLWEMAVLDRGKLRWLEQRTQVVTAPAWSPDGQRLAFVTRIDQNSDIYIMNADGTNLRRLTSGRASNNHPTWKP